MRLKLKWLIGERPSGRYRSFHKRSWPTAWYGSVNGPIAIQLASVSGEGYTAQNRETEVLFVRFADYRTTPWSYKQLTARPVGVTEAKRIANKWLSDHAEVRHKEYQ